MDKLQQSLLLTNFRYNSHSKSLRIIAFQQLIEKSLLNVGRQSKTPAEISTHVAKALGLKSINTGFVKEALQHSEKERRVVRDGSKWKLEPKILKEINEETQHFDRELNHILKMYFERLSVPPKLQKAWFVEACTLFFKHYGDEFIQNISKTTHAHTEYILDEILAPTFTRDEYIANREDLVRAFDDFLSSTNQRENAYLQDITMAMVASRIVAANIGVDPLNLDVIRGTKYLLDTNILLIIALQKNLDAGSLEILGSALNELGVMLRYTSETRDEYMRVVRALKSQTIATVENFPYEVLRETNDDFMTAAIQRGARSAEEFEQFFSEIMEFPPSMPGLELLIEEDNKIEEVIEKAKNDDRIAKKIKETSLEKRGWQRRDAAVEHDVVLISVARFLKSQDEKVTILTTDKIMTEYLADEDKRNEYPLGMTFDLLIDLLAIHSGGLTVHASDFAPLLAKVIANRCVPTRDAYKTEDLAFMHSANEKVSNFSAAELRRINQQIRTVRMYDPEDKQIQLVLDRAFVNKGEREKDEMQAILKETNKANDKLNTENKLLRKEKIDLLMKPKVFKQKIIFGAIAVALLASLFMFVYLIVSSLSSSTLAGIFIASFVDIITFVKWFDEIRSRYLARINALREEVQKSNNGKL